MLDFNDILINPGSEETNHYGTKPMDELNSYNLFVAQNNNLTRYDCFRDKMDTIDYMVISPNVIASISNVNSKVDIASDHCTMTAPLTPQKLRLEFINTSLKLYQKNQLSKVNENIKIKLNKLSGIFCIIKRPTTEIKLFLDKLENKLIEIIHHKIENNIPEIKIKEFTVEPERKFPNQEKILIEMNIFNDKDLQTADISEDHRSIEEKELENINQILGVKIAYRENKITNKINCWWNKKVPIEIAW